MPEMRTWSVPISLEITQFIEEMVVPFQKNQADRSGKEKKVWWKYDEKKNVIWSYAYQFRNQVVEN